MSRSKSGGVGTLMYNSPEIHEKETGRIGGKKWPINMKSDIWSVGIVIQEMLTGNS